MGFRVLVVEDDEKIGNGLIEAFAREGYEATLSGNGEDGFFHCTTGHFDLVVLDLGLPGRDGLEILEALRKLNKECLVLILSSRDEIEDRVRGLAAGADDYLVKPFAIVELLARIEALLRRGRTDVVLRRKVSDLQIDLVTRKVTRAGQRVSLTALEFELLEYLMRYAGETVSRGMLARDIWQDVERATPLDNVIDVHIARLRRKIERSNLAPLIHTVRGVGFRLDENEPI